MTDGNNNQCDQMARLYFQYLVAQNNENLPNGIKINIHFAKDLINTLRIAEGLIFVAKVAEFRQI